MLLHSRTHPNLILVRGIATYKTDPMLTVVTPDLLTSYQFHLYKEQLLIVNLHRVSMYCPSIGSLINRLDVMPFPKYYAAEWGRFAGPQIYIFFLPATSD